MFNLVLRQLRLFALYLIRVDYINLTRCTLFCYQYEDESKRAEDGFALSFYQECV